MGIAENMFQVNDDAVKEDLKVDSAAPVFTYYKAEIYFRYRIDFRKKRVIMIAVTLDTIY